MADDILFNVKGDSSSAISTVQELITILGELDKTLQSIGESLTVFDEFASALDNLYSAANLASAGIQALWLQTEDAVNSLNASAKSLQSISQSLNSINTDSASTAINTLANDVGNLSEIASIAGIDVDNLGQSGGAASTALDQTATSATSAADASDKIATAAAAAAAALDQQTAAQDAANASAQQAAADEEVEVTDIDQLAASIAAADTAVSEFLTAATEMEAALQGDTTAATEAIAAFQGWADSVAAIAANEAGATASVDLFSSAMGAQNNAMLQSATTMSAGNASMVQFGSTAQQATQDAAPLNDVFGSGAMNLVLMAGVIGMVGGSFLSLGMQAQSAISHITGLADQSLALSSNSQELNGIIDQLSSSAMKYGVSLTNASNGLYYIISAGFKTSDAMIILDSSMKAAAATGTQMDIVSNALTSIMNAYSLKAGDAAQVTDKMVQTVVSGKQEFSAFANAIGPVASAADHAGVSLNEMFAAEASLTQINPRVRQDAQQLAQLFNTLSNNGQKIVDTANSMGAHLTLASFEAMPLIDKLQLLSKIAGGDTTEAFKKLLVNQTAATTAFNLLRDGGSAYRDMLDNIAHSQGALDTAFQQTSQDVQFGLDRIQSALSVISYQFVATIGPVVTPILDQIANAVSFVAAHFQQFEPIIIGLTAYLTTVFIGAIIAVGGMLLTFAGPITGVATAIGLISTAVALVMTHLSDLDQWLTKNVPAWSSFKFLLQQLADLVTGALTMAWNNLLMALNNVATWIRGNISPAVVDIANKLVQLGEQVLVKVIPAIDAFIHNTLEPLVKKILSDVVPALEKFLKDAMDLANYISSHWPQISQQVSDALKVIGDILGIVGGAFAAFGVVVGVNAAGGIASFIVNAAAPLMAWLSGLPAAISTAFMGFIAATEPFGLVIILIGALIGLFIALTTQSKQLQDAWATLLGPMKDLWDALAGAFNDVAQAVQQDLWPALQDLGKALQPLVPYIKELAIGIGLGLIAAIGIFIEALAAVIEFLGKFIAGLVRATAEGVRLFQAIGAAVKDFFGLIGAIIFGNKGDIEKAWGQLGQDMNDIMAHFINAVIQLFVGFFGGIIQATQDFINKTIKFFTDLSNVLVGNSIIPDMLNKIIQLFKDFPGKVLQAIGQWVQDVIQWFQKLADEIVGHSIIPDMLNKIIQLFQQLPQRVSQVIGQFVQDTIKFFTDLAQNVVKAGSDMMSTFAQNIGQGLQQTGQAIQQGLDQAVQFIKDLPQKAAQWGADFIKGFADGIMSQASQLLQSVQQMAQQIASYLHFSKPDVGPLSDADTWGSDFGDLLAKNLTAQAHKVGNAARNIATSINGSMLNPGSFNAVIAPSNSNDAHLAVLKDILATLKSNNQGQGVMGRSPVPASLGTLQQQFVLNATPGTSAANLYSQMNTLLGLSFEYGNRGAGAGLGI